MTEIDDYMKKLMHQRIAILVTSIAILFFACTESQKGESVDKTDEQKERITDTEQKEFSEQADLSEAEKVRAMRLEAEAMLQKLKEKETLLEIKQDELEALRQQLDEKETELAQREEHA